MIKKGADRILVVGGGPVGLLLSLQLHSLGHRVHTFERRSHPSGHAKAHYLSMRSMEILEEVAPKVLKGVQAGAPPLHQWEYFTYSSSVFGGRVLGRVNQFERGLRVK